MQSELEAIRAALTPSNSLLTTVTTVGTDGAAPFAVTGIATVANPNQGDRRILEFTSTATLSISHLSSFAAAAGYYVPANSPIRLPVSRQVIVYAVCPTVIAPIRILEVS